MKLQAGATVIGKTVRKDRQGMIHTFTVYFGNVLSPVMSDGRIAHLKQKEYEDMLAEFLDSPEGMKYDMPTEGEVKQATIDMLNKETMLRKSIETASQRPVRPHPQPRPQPVPQPAPQAVPQPQSQPAPQPQVAPQRPVAQEPSRPVQTAPVQEPVRPEPVREPQPVRPAVQQEAPQPPEYVQPLHTAPQPEQYQEPYRAPMQNPFPPAQPATQVPQQPTYTQQATVSGTPEVTSVPPSVKEEHPETETEKKPDKKHKHYKSEPEPEDESEEPVREKHRNEEHGGKAGKILMSLFLFLSLAGNAALGYLYFNGKSGSQEYATITVDDTSYQVPARTVSLEDGQKTIKIYGLTTKNVDGKIENIATFLGEYDISAGEDVNFNASPSPSATPTATPAGK